MFRTKSAYRQFALIAQKVTYVIKRFLAMRTNYHLNSPTSVTALNESRNNPVTVSRIFFKVSVFLNNRYRIITASVIKTNRFIYLPCNVATVRVYPSDNAPMNFDDSSAL